MSVQPEWVFETPDYEGTPVVLSRATWLTKAGNDQPGTHPEIRDYLKEVQAAIRCPDFVFQSTRDERSRIFYLLGAGRGDFAGNHLVIVVKYVEETPVRRRGYVSTMYLSRTVYSRGVLLWSRTENALP